MELKTIQVDSAPCPPPIDYGYVVPNSTGNKLNLSYVGTPSQTAGNFELRITGGVPNAVMGIFVGTEPRHFQLAAGLFLVGGSVTRLAPVQLDGSGTANIPVPVTPSLIGTEVYYQAVCRDLGTPQDIALSNGLHVDYCN